MACRTAAGLGAAAVLALSFPLHPPGRPERTRAAELAAPSAAGVPVHVVQGRSDPFGTPEEVAAVLPAGCRLTPVDGPHALERSAPAVTAAALAALASVP
ncbi:alpha/beta family hydrolase [Phycicoccus endophyticus]|uniref:alpha/beta family hydrolase n=1 Tax=Phycicoccus endophyticus TaxID=1690220 RepID=UPI001CB6D259|nr:alpha/beta family hydrolase [Phycicoccus endophyticus]